MTDRYLVVGNPIAQSRSPQIQRQFAEQKDEDISYEAMLVDIDGFEKAAAEFFDGGGMGMNITMPFKEDAYRFAHRLSPGARIAGAVNTLVAGENGEIIGHNTDAAGLIADILRQEKTIAGQSILILGAGGAVRGVLGPLLQGTPSKLTIANRTFEKAQQLAKGFAGYGPIQACPMQNLGTESFDLIINGTSTSLAGAALELPADILTPNSFCYDMVYAAEPTPFMSWAISQGATASDGLGMLVGQAAESFRIWRGISPNFVKIIATIRTEMLNEQA
jgi:shikimate dehydrogenase|tara:strand:- start:48512 stop:49342 length:831 start_codon:yes stop_codon:yes gene_type:complete